MKPECSAKVLRNVWLTFHSIKRKVAKWNKDGLISVARSVCRIILTAPIFTFFYCLYVAYTTPNQVTNFVIFIFVHVKNRLLFDYTVKNYLITFSSILIVAAWHVYPLWSEQFCIIGFGSNCQASKISDNMDDSNNHSRTDKAILLIRAYKVLR